MHLQYEIDEMCSKTKLLICLALTGFLPGPPQTFSGKFATHINHTS